jgi:predicted lipoprotein with Yx(FWY)xxD motif
MAAAIVVAAGLVAACSSAATAQPAASSAPASLAAGAQVTIGTGSSATLGTYLTGAGGMTIYIRTADPAGGSSCTGGCASAWPPLTVEAGEQPLAGSDVTGTLATFARSDGSLQVTNNGRALYYYAADTKPGDTSGQGVGGVWFVAPVSGSGSAASPTPSASAAAPSAGASSSY